MTQLSRPLQQINILITRPEHQSKHLAEHIRKLGGNPVIFPVLEISDIEDKTFLLQLIQRLDKYALGIFVSPNAVHKAIPLIQSKRALPKQMKIAVVGKSSADALKQYGIEQVIMPHNRFDSEALLEHEALQHVSGQRVVIFRGSGGRPLLGDTLKQRGALLEYAQCYNRSKPNVDPSGLLLSWSQGKINAVVITSSEGLQNLFDIIGQAGQQLLTMTPVFATHERIARLAQEAGLKKVVQTTSTGDEGILLSLREYFCMTRRQQ